MRIYLLLLTFFSTLGSVFAQAPVIEGDTMLCPWTEGTATVTGTQVYDSYQWYAKPMFPSNAEFVAVEGATEASFTYDWYTYDVNYIKVEVTLNGETLESNTIFVDSHTWAGLLVEHSFDEDQVLINPDNGHFMVCPGATITNTVSSPYTVVQWYKNGLPITFGTSTTYTITEPGTYYAIAAPAVCPTTTSKSPDFVVEFRTDCTGNPETPVIVADNTMMCPDTSSLVHLAYNHEYDSYQWYYKYWFQNDNAFAAIEGATSPSFEYDWLTYDQAVFKLVVTLDGQTYESNTVQIDSYQWAGMIVNHSYSEDEVSVHPDNGHFMTCPGFTITNTVEEGPYSAYQWFNGQDPIEGAIEPVYVITEPGVYRVVATNSICPNASNTSPAIFVEYKEDCTSNTENPALKNSFVVYPNPANNVLNLQLGSNVNADNFTIYDITGKKLTEGSLNGNLTGIDIQSLAKGSYIIKVNGNGATASKLFIKQ